MSKVKYTKELLASICRDSISVAEVIRALGLKEAGGTHTHLSRKIKEYGIDTSKVLITANTIKAQKRRPGKRLWSNGARGIDNILTDCGGR